MSNLCLKRVMIAAPRSGSGKTTVTCALLEALKKRGLGPVSFKCGPDYIDPLFHRKVLGIDGRNLDTFFSGTDGVRSILSACGDRYAVIEGVMGLYDGMSASGTQGSSYEVAAAADIPIVLVVDASGIGRTVISLIKGMLCDDTERLIRGVLLNRISAGFYEALRPVLEKELREFREDVRLLGFLPKNKEISIGSRHLGLKLPGEIDDIKKKIEDAASMLEENADVAGIISIMEESGTGKDTTCAGTVKDAAGTATAPHPQRSVPGVTSALHKDRRELTLAVAYDDAFCFYYRDNLELFEKHGVRIRFFSPLTDRELPAQTDGLLLGGGYPENHLGQLSRNTSMLASVREALDRGVPSLAECGGFMYLHKTITDQDGNAYEMVGAVDGDCCYTGRLVRFGYMEIEAVQEEGAKDPMIRALAGMRGHEFHYFDSTCNGNACVAAKPYGNRKWECMVFRNNGIWGFPHFYYHSDPAFIEAFIKRMRS